MHSTKRLFGEIQLGLHEKARPETGGFPILFFHGVGRHGRDFAPLFGPLGHDRSLFSLDARGHGLSDRTPGHYHIRDHTIDAIAVLEAITQSGKFPAVIFGHSMGALEAMGAASLRPDLVRGVILEDPPGPGFLANLDTNPYKGMFEAMRGFAGSTLPTPRLAAELAEVRLSTATGGTVRLGDVRDMASLRLSASCLAHVDPAVYDPLLAKNWLTGIDFEAMLKEIPRPVLLLAGEESKGGMLPKTEADHIASLVTDCLLVRFPQTGHLIHWTATEACLAAVHAFLESLD